MRLPIGSLLAFAAAFVLAAPASSADLGFGDDGARIPASTLGRPMTWFDPSRLKLATTVSVGTGFGGGTTSGLQTTRLSYQFDAPLWMSVSVGNAFGGRSRDGSAFFLEGIDLAWRPSPSMVFQVHYQDLRSPLQYRDSAFGYARDYIGPR